MRIVRFTFAAVLAVFGCAIPAIAGTADDFIFLEAADDLAPADTYSDPAQASWPVLRVAAETPLLSEIRSVLGHGIAPHVSTLDQRAQQLRPDRAGCAPLRGKLAIYLSKEDGGFARQGFWLLAPDGSRIACPDPFIDMTVDPASLASGEFEEVLAHEWGHVLLRRLWGPVPPADSRKFHSVRTITDPATAFDEGMGIHLQPAAFLLTETPGFRARVVGTAPTSLADSWFSREESWLREVAVPRNQFAFAKLPLPVGPDPLVNWKAGETSVALSPCSLKAGNEMVASEGVVAAFLFKLLAARLPDMQRYERAAEVLAAIGAWPTGDPPLISFVRAWGERFPDEREAVTRLFLDTTYGATASRNVANLAESAACAGAAGDLEAFLAARAEAATARETLLQEVLEGRTALDAALGPQLWLANSAVRLPSAPWSGEQEIPAIADLNTATPTELELVLRGTPAQDMAEAIHTARAAGPFASIEDAAARANLTPSQAAAVAVLAAAHAGLPPRVRD